MNVLFLGETKTSSPYLAGVLLHAGFTVRHIPIRQKVDRLDTKYDLIIMSDYASTDMDLRVEQDIVTSVQEGGTGFLMVGGWYSFGGLESRYRTSLIAQILPIEIADRDDRINAPGGMLLSKLVDHPSIEGLDWDRPPVVCGFNRAGGVKPEAGTLIAMYPTYGPHVASPLLVIHHGRTYRAAALMTDLAPHWCGGLPDWGDTRVQLSGAEVGHHFYRFVHQLCLWLVGKN